ncbi:EpsG family protein [Staphylococcus ureilyticus]|uniref:EpsG family protein n=1 Tax=Staphylococcus ureilyticus TaxID=94138 RepID=UPI00387B627A
MIIIITLALILLILLYFSNYKLSQSVSIIVFSLFFLNLIIKLLNKNLTESTDFLTYISVFNSIINLDFYNMIKTDIFEILFRVMSWLFMYFFPNSTFIIFVILINAILSISIYRFFDDKILSIFSLLIYTYSPLFFSMTTNILRQMLVISIIMLVLTLNKEKRWISLIFPTIHFSSIVFIIFIYFQKYIKVKYFVSFGVFCLFLFVTNLNSRIFGSLPIVSDYTSQQTFENYGGQPNRLDFLIFTIFIVLVSLVLYKLKLISTLWLKYSLFSSSYYLMFAFQAFSERYAIYNWILLIFLLPLILQAIKRRFMYK